ncbi:MAP7 domain-containing protein 2 [Drosophila subpulchrella]|uniref:MAP7 domain-containing protein 2 n=1 Tax=Drosophila subpulchrella TaxID=1486046 RepID=UPI0018A17652|nr:MAP7 domain-containing protein 2 [Drosophila subpulchrella]
MAEAIKKESNAQQRPLDGGGGGGGGGGSGGGGGGGGGGGAGMPKRKHRRGKKSKMLPKKTKNHYPQWKLDMPAGAGATLEGNTRQNSRTKLVRSRSLLVPYNTNRFLMEEHMSELHKDDSDDNCFGSQTEDQVLFLSKEFSNVYERARLERLETMSKQELIQECLQIEDRYSKAQNVSKEFGAKIRAQEEKMRQLTRENQFLRSHFLRSCSTSAGPTAAAAAAASPPSAVAPTPSSACELQARQQPPQQPQPTPMDSSSEDSESDSSSTTSSTTSSTSSSSSDAHEMGVAGLNIANGHAERHERSPTRSRSRSPIHLNGHANDEERQRLLDGNQMDEDDNSTDVPKPGDAVVK